MKKLVFVFTALSLVAFTAMAQDAAIASGNGLLSTSKRQVLQAAQPMPTNSLGATGFSIDLPSFNTLSAGYLSPFDWKPNPRIESAEDEATFPKGSLAFGLGIGLGDLYWGGYGSALGVSPVFDVDYALTDKIGIGNISVGGTVSYSSSQLSTMGYTVNYSAILIGLRGEYHFILDVDALKGKLDPYGGVMLGFIVTNNPNTNGYDAYFPGDKGSAFQPGIFAGAHYYFVRHFGAFAELGYNGFSIFTIGITVKTK